jgi:hypothetical protein
VKRTRVLAILAACIALACVAIVPATASACSHCSLQITKSGGAEVHSSPGGTVIGHFVQWTPVYVIESADSGVWCNVQDEETLGAGWVLCADLGE